MSFFQRSVNVRVAGDSDGNRVAAVRETIVAALSKKGWKLCDEEDDAVDRTLLIAPHADGWLTVIDDEFEQEPFAAERFVDALKRFLPGPFLIVEIDDNLVSDLMLREGVYSDILSPPSVAYGWSIVANPPWATLLADKRLALDSSRVYKDLAAVVDALGLNLHSWMELAAEYEEDQTADGAFIRLRRTKPPPKDPAIAELESLVSDKTPAPDPSLVLPAFLVGDLRTVRRRWKKIMATLLKSRSWSEAMKGQEMVVLATSPYVLFRDAFSMDTAVANVFRLTVVPEALCGAACDDNYARYPLVRDLILEGMDQFWMCVTMLGDYPTLLPRAPNAVEETDNARMILGKFCRWWNELCSLEGLYHAGWLPEKWPHWARRLWPLMVDAGIPRELSRRMDKGSPIQAGVLLKSWLEQQPE